MENKYTTIKIELKNKKLYISLIMTVVLILLSLFFIFYSYMLPDIGLVLIVTSKIFGFIFTALSISAMINFIKRFINKKSGLILNADGIIDNSGDSINIIKWEDIKEIKEIILAGKQKFIIIFISNPEEYIMKAGKIKRKLMRINNDVYGSPLSLSASWFDCTHEELKNIIESKYNEYKDIKIPA